MIYAVYMNNQLVNKFSSYERACDLVEWLERTFKGAIVEIEPEY